MELLDVRKFSELSEEACIGIQERLAEKVVEHGLSFPVRTAAGVDLAYWEEDGEERAVCCIVVVDCETRTAVEKRHASGAVRFPYVPGCLAFRELPLVLAAAETLSHWPDVFIFDGNGLLHPRRMGLAAHASFYLDTPTIGIAKRYSRWEGQSFTMPEASAGSWSDITKGGQVLGCALRTHAGVKPVFVSVGNRVDLDTAVRLAMSLTEKESRIPIPTRFADLETHILREKLRNRAALEGGNI